MTDKTEIIILRETLIEGFLSDLITIAVFGAMFAPGVVFNSSAMQWVGAFCFMLWVIGRASKHSARMTIAQARKHLDEIEAKQ